MEKVDMSTSLEGDQPSDQEAFDKIKVKVLHLNFCEASDDPELVAMADVEVTDDTSVLVVNGLGLRYNDTTGDCSIVEPKTPSGACMNRLIRIAVTHAVMDRYVHRKHSDELLEKLSTATSIDRKEYGEILPAITAHFDIDNMDVHDCLKKCRLELKAAYAYIKHLENGQLRVTKVDVAPCSMKDDPSRLADVVAVINDGLVIRGIRLYAASQSTSNMFCKDGMYIAYPELIGSCIYPAAYPIQSTSDDNLQSQLLDKVIERYKAMPDARTLPLSWKDILQVGKKYYVKFRPYGHPHISMLSNIVGNSAICECVMEKYQPDVKNPDGKPYVPEKALIVKYTITSDMALRDVPYYAIPECEWDQSIDTAVSPKDGLLYLKPWNLTDTWKLIDNMTDTTSTRCTEVLSSRHAVDE